MKASLLKVSTLITQSELTFTTALSRELLFIVVHINKEKKIRQCVYEKFVRVTLTRGNYYIFLSVAQKVS